MKKIVRNNGCLSLTSNESYLDFAQDDERNKSIASIYKDVNDRLWIDCRAARLGIMNYRNADGTISREVNLPEDLFSTQTINSAFGVPVTFEHPLEGVVDARNHKTVSIGTVMFPAKIDDNYFLRMRIQIFDDTIIDEIIRKISSGEGWEVSCGYSANLEIKSGNFNGLEFDAIHRDILYNHLALVRKGRAGREVSLVEKEVDMKW